MKTEARRRSIIEHLMEVGSATVEDFASRYSVSKMTIHRDLDQLEIEGQLRKVRGGATVESSSQFEADYQYRKRQCVEEKRVIASAAAALVEPGQSVILDDGSTISTMSSFLLERRPLTVITTNAAVIFDLMGVQGLNLITLGGQYNRRFHGFVGLVAEQALQSIRADQAFISTSSLEGTKAFHQDIEIVKTKRAIIAAASRRHLLVDHTKFDRTALHVLCDLSEFDQIITGGPISKTAQMHLADSGARLLVAEGKCERHSARP